MGYVPAHVHSEFSLLDGAIRMDQYAQWALQQGFPAISLTDHGSLAGIPSFYRACKNAGVNPIVGYEAYFTDDISVKDRDQIYHLTLVAKNLEGYRNLIKMDSIAQRQGFYYKPRIDWNILKEHSEGIICLSGCLAAQIPQHILRGDIEKAYEYAHKYREVFGDDFFIEIQDHGLADQKAVLPHLVEMANKLGLPIIATSDAHYLTKADAEFHRILLAVQTGKTLEQIEKEGGFEGFWSSSEFYVKEPNEFRKTFKKYPEAIQSTLELAKRCNISVPEFDKLEYRFPKFELPEGKTASQLLREYCEEGLIKRVEIDYNFNEYVERMEYELEVIEKLGFPEYFLIVRDFVVWAKENGIPTGVGRGSVGGSLVAYLLRITDVDPLEHGLLFERFLNPDRVSLPDIDVDVADDSRHLVYEYLQNKYGVDHTCHIGTFGTMGLKAAFKDVARAFGYDFAMTNEISKFIPDMGEVESLRDIKEIRSLMQEDSKFRRVIEAVERLEGIKRHASVHAAGVVVSPVPLNEICPIREVDGEIVSQWDMGDLESIGLVKFDLLGLRTLRQIRDTLNLIKENRGIEIDIDNIPMDDRKTWELFRRGETVGVFQFEGGAVRNVIVRMQPSEFNDLVNATSIARPGPLDYIDEKTGKSMTDLFIERKLGREPVVYDHPLLEPILRDTYGIIVYQEDLMRIVSELAGFSMAKADEVRKYCGKKDKKKLEQLRSDFIEGCLNRNDQGVYNRQG